MLALALRLVLAAVAVGLGAAALAAGHWTGLGFVAVGALLALTGLFGDAPGAAYRAIERGDLRRAERCIGRVRRPERLGERKRAHYEYVRGMLAVEAGDLAAAERHLDAALAGRLATANDRAAMACYLAESAHRQGELPTARRHLERARAFRHRPETARAIAEIEEVIAADERDEERR